MKTSAVEINHFYWFIATADFSGLILLYPPFLRLSGGQKSIT